MAAIKKRKPKRPGVGAEAGVVSSRKSPVFEPPPPAFPDPYKRPGALDPVGYGGGRYSGIRPGYSAVPDWYYDDTLPRPEWAEPPTPPDRRDRPVSVAPVVRAPVSTAPATVRPVKTPATTSSETPGDVQSFYREVLRRLLNPPPGPTQAEMLAQAQRAAAATLVPSEKVLRDAQEQARLDAERRAAFQRDVNSALAELLRGIGPSTQATYQAAARDQSAFGKGFSDGLRMAAERSAGDTNAFLAKQGAPAGQMVPTGEGSPAQAASDVLYGLGGYIPASTLGREGAAFTAAANQLPATAAGQGARQAAGELEKGRLDVRDIGFELAKLEAQRPGMVQAALQQLQLAANQGRSLSQTDALFPLLLADRFEKYPGVNPVTGAKTKAQAELELRIGDQQIKLAQLDLSLKKYLTASRGWFVDESGQVTLTPEAQRIVLAQAKAKRKASSPAQQAKWATLAGTYAEDSFSGFWAFPADPTRPVKGDDLNSLLARDDTDNPEDTGLAFYRRSYAEAMNDLLAKGVPLVVAQRALNRYWQEPGQTQPWEKPGTGRPRKSFQQRPKKKKK